MIPIFQQETLLGDWRRQLLACENSNWSPSGKQFLDSTPPSDSRSTVASTSLSMDYTGAVDSGLMPSSSRPNEVMFLLLSFLVIGLLNTLELSEQTMRKT